MPNYLDEQSYTAGKFQLTVYPYIAVPENVFEPNIALQYGADFKMTFTRGGTETQRLGLIQLIFPQTQIFPATQVQAWNVDKRARGTDPITMGQCLYSDDVTKVGNHSDYYKNQNTRSLAEGSCFLIDTPREINSTFDRQTGTFSGNTTTKFANYVVELSSRNGVIFNNGILWGYSVRQDGTDKYKFGMAMTGPAECLLTDNNEHLNALAAFLGSTKEVVKSYIS